MMDMTEAERVLPANSQQFGLCAPFEVSAKRLCTIVKQHPTL